VIVISYKHVFDGFLRIVHEEGPHKLMTGLSMHLLRGALVTIGQAAFYDQVKEMLLHTGYFHDTVFTHLLGSALAVSVLIYIHTSSPCMRTRKYDQIQFSAQTDPICNRCIRIRKST
jgi:hypothetical protein